MGASMGAFAGIGGGILSMIEWNFPMIIKGT
jgi:hypothetical protein